MNLGIFLGIGESLSQMEKSGQTERFINSYLTRYAKNFKSIYLFSYADESYKLPKNVILVTNKYHIHRYLYAFLLPIVNLRQILECNVFRGFGLTSTVPAFFTFKPFVFNWAYDYIQSLKIERKYLLIPMFKILEVLAFLRASRVFVATKIKLKKLSGQKYAFLPNGVDLKIFKKQSSQKKGLVFVGRFERQKNLFFLIDAVSKLPQNYKKITFIGRGSQEGKLEKYALKNGVTLKIMPPVSNFKLPRLLSQFSIFTLPSFVEGSPKVLLEAMATGLVPVVTNFLTAKEVIKDEKDGFITNFDEKDFASKIKLLLSDEILYKRMSQNAVLKIKKEFDQNILIEKEISVLKNV